MSYKTRDAQEEQTPDQWGDMMPCTSCQKAVTRKTLSDYGSRCFTCHEAYLAKPNPTSTWVREKREEGPRAWAHALKAREQNGERLGSAIQKMMNAALKERCL